MAQGPNLKKKTKKPLNCLRTHIIKGYTVHGMFIYNAGCLSSSRVISPGAQISFCRPWSRGVFYKIPPSPFPGETEPMTTLSADGRASHCATTIPKFVLRTFCLNPFIVKRFYIHDFYSICYIRIYKYIIMIIK